MTSIQEIPLSQLAPTLATDKWASGPLHFVGDVGGTNARLGFGNFAQGQVHIIYARFEMSKKHIGQMLEFLDTLLKVVPTSVLTRIQSGAVTVPGPVNCGVAGPFNNLEGVAKLSEYPRALFPVGRSALLNDLEAGGHGILLISEANAFAEYFTLLWEGSQWQKTETTNPAGSVLGHGSCLIAAPGTGLGSCLLHYNNASGRHEVLPLELGSMTGTIRRGREAFHKGFDVFLCRSEPSMEDMSVGQAVQFAYLKATHRLSTFPTQDAATKGGWTVAAIAKLAKSGDDAALQAMQIAYENLMVFLSEGAMSFLPLTCVVMGDNVVSNGFLFEDPAHVAALRRAMLSHHMELHKFISRTTVVRQSKVVNLNLLGCLGYGIRLEKSAKM